MHGFMAACGPTSALAQSRGVIRAADPDSPATHLLEVTFQTQIRVAHGQHLRLDGPVRLMAGGATFAHRLVLEHKRTALGGMALQTGFVF